MLWPTPENRRNWLLFRRNDGPGSASVTQDDMIKAGVPICGVDPNLKQIPADFDKANLSNQHPDLQASSLTT
jgi:hypothetical protein